jgi:hypothetical protein
MTPDRMSSKDGHPQPYPVRMPAFTVAFGLLGGPLAWFLELCAGYGLASWSCFPKDHRGITPIEGVGWTWPTMVGLLAASIVIALLSLMASWRVFQQTREARQRDYYHLIDDGDGRVAFLTLWGVILGAGFAITTLLDVVAYVVLPRCAG